jgi:hypothetical protein
LLSTVEVQPGLVRLDLVSCEIALAPHGPYRCPLISLTTACTNSFASGCPIAC